MKVNGRHVAAMWPCGRLDSDGGWSQVLMIAVNTGGIRRRHLLRG